MGIRKQMTQEILVEHILKKFPKTISIAVWGSQSKNKDYSAS